MGLDPILIPILSSGCLFHNFTTAAEGFLSQPFTCFALVLLDLQHVEEPTLDHSTA